MLRAFATTLKSSFIDLPTNRRAIRCAWYFWTTLLISTFYCPLILAHAEHSQSLYVYDTGIEDGRCNNPITPCKSISYARSQANKGDQIKLASGHYAIDDADTLLYLLSDLVPVMGRYNTADGYAKTNEKNLIYLSGVPLEYTEKLARKGFTVIVDSKGRNQQKDRQLRKSLKVYQRLKQKTPATNCVNGFAGDHACSNIDLLAHLPLSSFSSDPSAANDI